MKNFMFFIFSFLLIFSCMANAQVPVYDAAYDPGNSLVNNNEPSIAVNPANNQNIIIGTNYRLSQLVNGTYSYVPGQIKIGLYYTTDFGTSWNSIILPSSSEYQKYADPSVAFKTDGTAFCSYLGVNDQAGGDLTGALFVNKSTNSGSSWMSVPYTLPTDNSKTNDKPYIHIDTYSTGAYRNRVYVSYSEGDGLGMPVLNKIKLTYLNEATGTFVTPRLLNNPADYYVVQGSVPYSDKQGNLYVAFYAKERDPLVPGNSISKIKIVKSTDGGDTFPLMRDAAPSIQPFVDDKSGAALTVNGQSFRAHNLPSIAIDRSSGQYQNTIYVAYADKPEGMSAHIMLVKSTDAGNTWSSPVQISSDEGGDNFFPWITVNNNGILSIVYYKLTYMGGIEDYISPKFKMSADGGNSFVEANLNDSFDLNCNINNFLGDYIGIASTQDYTIPVWTSTEAFSGHTPQVGKIAKIPFMFPVTVKNVVPSGTTSRMLVDGQVQSLPFSGLTLSLNPFSSHTFSIVDEVYSNAYKFRNWDGNIYNKTMTIPVGQLQYGKSITSYYKSAYLLTITDNLEGAGGGSNTIQWTSPDHSESYSINSGSTFYAFKYDANSLDKYSISVPGSINNYLGTNWTFRNWNDGSTALAKQNLQITGPVSYTAYYKGSLRSNTSTAFSNSSQRKFIRTPDGSLHVVYESMGYVWYERSSDGGNTWIIMNGGKPLSTNPSKSPSIDYCGSSTSGYIGIVFQEKNPNLWESEGKIKYYPVFYSNGVYGNSPLQDIEFLYDETYDSFNVSPVIAFGSTSPYFLVVWKGLEGLTTKFFNGNNSNAIAPLSYSSVLYSVSDYTSEHPFLVSNKLGNTIFHLAWDENTSSTSGTIRYCKLSAGSTVDVVGGSYNSNVSSGCGYSKNSMPSLIPASDNTVRMSWTGSEIYDMTSSVFRGMFGDGSWNPRFWSFGSNVVSQCINLGSDGYFILFSDYISGVYRNQFTDSRTLSNIYTLNTTGKDLQLNNDAGGTSRTMYAMAFSSQGTAPYSFTRSNTIGSYYGLYKENSKETSGRTVVLKADSLSEFYFSLRDISLDGKPVKFMEVSDSLRIHDVNGLNKYVTTEPFTLTDNSKFLFNLNYGVTDSSKGLKALGKEGNVSYSVDLIDEEGSVLQSLNKVIFSKDSFLKHKKGSFQVNMKGIGNKTVRMRLRTEVNLSAECFLVDSHSMIDENGGMYKTSETEKIDYSGEKAVKEYAISRNYPNPFNPSTVIDFEVPRTSKVTLKIYDMLGREVATLVNGLKEMGRYSVEFNASSLPSGTYIYEIRANDFVKSGKMMLLK